MIADSVAVLKVTVDVAQLGWPKEGVRAFGCAVNRSYDDFSRTRWRDVDIIVEEEGRLLSLTIDRLKNGDDALEALSDIEHEFSLGGVLDLGTAAATLALNAARCPTITACIGHVARYPHVIFWARPSRIDVLCAAARDAGIGLGNALDGTLEIYTGRGDIVGLWKFARRLRSASRQLKSHRSAKIVSSSLR